MRAWSPLVSSRRQATQSSSRGYQAIPFAVRRMSCAWRRARLDGRLPVCGGHRWVPALWLAPSVAQGGLGSARKCVQRTDDAINQGFMMFTRAVSARTTHLSPGRGIAMTGISPARGVWDRGLMDRSCLGLELRGGVHAMWRVAGGGRPILRGLRRSVDGVPVLWRAGDAWQRLLPWLRLCARR
jgi:hypothetical protein